MKKLILILVCVFAANVTFAQQFNKKPKNDNWNWNTIFLYDYGFQYWSSDYGGHTNFDTGAEIIIHNNSKENSNIVLNGRSDYIHFHARDDYSRVTRSLLRVSGGIGLQVYDRIFGTVNVGHIWVINEAEGEGDLSSMMASIKGNIILFKLASNWSMIVSGEGGITFQDMDFRDPPLQGIYKTNPDRFTGTGFFRGSIGFAYTFNK